MKRNEESYWRKFDIADNEKRLHTTVRDAPNAWFSYALDAPALMAKATPLASEDIVIESIAPSSTANGTFDLTVSIAGAEIGEGARLAEVLGIEGAAELDESAFSSDGLTVSLDRTDDGKAKATVTPEGSPASFFLRVKVKRREKCRKIRGADFKCHLKSAPHL